MFKLLIIIATVLYLIYWLTMALHITRVVVITNRKIRMYRLLIPFYYWMAPLNEKSLTNKIKKKDGLQKQTNGNESDKAQ